MKQDNERERIIAERRAQVEQMNKDKKVLVKKAAKLLRKPVKRPGTMANRLAKAIALLMQAQHIEFRQHAIVSQPLPRPEPSFLHGRKEYPTTGIVGEWGREAIITPNGPVFTLIPEQVAFPQPDMKERWEEYVNSLKR